MLCIFLLVCSGSPAINAVYEVIDKYEWLQTRFSTCLVKHLFAKKLVKLHFFTTNFIVPATFIHFHPMFHGTHSLKTHFQPHVLPANNFTCKSKFLSYFLATHFPKIHYYKIYSTKKWGSNRGLGISWIVLSRSIMLVSRWQFLVEIIKIFNLNFKIEIQKLVRTEICWDLKWKFAIFKL